MEIIQEIIQLEWMQFLDVQNIGGRADCQNEPEEFALMRRAQFEAWPEEFCRSYLNDLRAAQEQGRNLLSEKYAYMMRFTHPDEYGVLASMVPPVSEEKATMIEEITVAQVEWSVEFAKRFPHVAGRGRAIRADADTGYATSLETYTRGEMATYSEKTLQLYLAYIRQLREEGRNLVYEIRDNTSRAMGYDNVEAAEAQLAWQFS